METYIWKGLTGLVITLVCATPLILSEINRRRIRQEHLKANTIKQSIILELYDDDRSQRKGIYNRCVVRCGLRPSESEVNEAIDRLVLQGYVARRFSTDAAMDPDDRSSKTRLLYFGKGVLFLTDKGAREAEQILQRDGYSDLVNRPRPTP